MAGIKRLLVETTRRSPLAAYTAFIGLATICAASLVCRMEPIGPAEAERVPGVRDISARAVPAGAAAAAEATLEVARRETERDGSRSQGWIAGGMLLFALSLVWINCQGVCREETTRMRAYARSRAY